MFNISLDYTSFRLEANKLLGPAFNDFLWFTRALAYADKAVLFMFTSYMKLSMYMYNRFDLCDLCDLC